MSQKKKKRMISMKTKLLGIILPVVIVMVVLLIGIVYFISRNVLTEYSQNLLTSSIQSQANEIEAWLDENLAAFQIVKRTIEGVKPSDEELEDILNQYYGYNTNFSDGIYIADASGRLIKAKDSDRQETDPTSLVWYQEGLTRVNMGFTNSYMNSDGEAVISASGNC